MYGMSRLLIVANRAYVLYEYLIICLSLPDIAIVINPITILSVSSHILISGSNIGSSYVVSICGRNLVDM